MPIKAIEAKVVGDDALKVVLRHTHEVYNGDLAAMTVRFLRMRNGSLGPVYKELWDKFLSGEGHPSGIMETLTTPKPVTESECGAGWKTLVRAIRAERGILFDRFQLWPHWNRSFRRHLFDDAGKWIRQHEERMQRWAGVHEEWLARREENEKANPHYMAIRPALVAFDEQFGQVAKRRHRWHLYLDFLAKHQELAAWRGGEAKVQPLSESEMADCRKDRRHGVGKAFELFFGRNPELQELDRLHGLYQREFARPWAKRRNADGFRHKPTMTLPHAVLHPEWITFQKDSSMYRRLDVAGGAVQLCLLRPDTDELDWFPCNFRGDQRFRWLKPAAPLVVGGDSFDWTFENGKGESWPAQIKGIRLLFREDRPYVKLTLQLSPPQRRIAIKQSACDKYKAKWAFKEAVKQLEGKIPNVLAVDLGIRNLAVAVVIRDGKPAATRFVKISGDGGAIPSLSAIAAHKRTLRRGRSRQGRAPKGHESFKALQAHVTGMGEDRYKKGASELVAIAHRHEVDLILIEKLAGFIPDAERERGVNRALVSWNRGHITTFIKTLAADYAIPVVEVDPRWLSQLCNRCGALGRRYSHKDGQVVFGEVEKLFACPACGYRCNSDFNAAVNLYRAFVGIVAERPKSAGKGVRHLGGLKIRVADIEAQLLPRLSPIENPF